MTAPEINQLKMQVPSQLIRFRFNFQLINNYISNYRFTIVFWQFYKGSTSVEL